MIVDELGSAEQNGRVELSAQVEPGRGLNPNGRRHELWEHAMYASFAARHPRTPGPRRQLRARARRELELALSRYRGSAPNRDAGPVS